VKERVQKILARAGYGSRRHCEQLVQAGRVTINRQVAILGSKADGAQDDIRVDDERIAPQAELRYVLLHKPVGVLCSLRSQGGHRTVGDLVPLPERLFPVGRLDLQSEGLLLMTNDGALANRLTHPRYEHEKEYRVSLDRTPDERQLKAWRKGVVLPDGRRTLPAQVTLESGRPPGAWVRVVMKEGRKRQIREVAECLGLQVRRLVRVRMASLRLGNLSPGTWRLLTEKEIQRVRREAGLGLRG
jgi:23S rRNA pseudouridine2605 synthase